MDARWGRVWVEIRAGLLLVVFAAVALVLAAATSVAMLGPLLVLHAVSFGLFGDGGAIVGIGFVAVGFLALVGWLAVLGGAAAVRKGLPGISPARPRSIHGDPVRSEPCR